MTSKDTEQGPTPVIIEYLKTQSQGASIQEIALALEMNRNLIAKYLSILHMQGRLDLRSYGNIKIYRLSNRIPFQSLSLLSEDFILGIDKSLRIRSYLGSGKETFGIQEEQIVGMSIVDIQIPSVFSPELLEKVRSVLSGTISHISGEEYLIRGSSVCIKFLSCIFDDGSSGVALLCSKLAMSKEQSSDYNRLLSRHLSLLSDMQEFYVEFSSDWQVLSTNSSLANYCGISVDTIIGTTGLPQVSSEDMDIIQQSITGAKTPVSEKFSVRVVLADGSVRWQEWIFHIQKFEDGQNGYHGFGLDISELKLKESQIEMYQSGVEALLHKKTEELREITSQLRREIDERRTLEKELKQREELYRNLTESTSDIIWEIDADKKFVFVNERVRSLFGYEPDHIIGTAPRDYIPSEEYEHVKEFLDYARVNNRPFDAVRVQIIRPNGTYAWIELSGVPIIRHDGTFHGYRGIGRDVTAKIIAELEQQQLLSIIESTPDLIAMADPEGTLIYMNRAGRKMLGISKETDITTFKNISFIDSEYQECTRIGRMSAIKQGTWTGDTVLVSTDGIHIPVSHTILSHQVLPGQNQILATIARDISDRLEYEQDLARAYAYNRNLIEISPDPLVTIGPDGKIQDVNQATEIATGYSRDHLIGTSFSLYFTEPEKADAGYQQVFSEGFVRDYPLEILRDDGIIMQVSYNAVLYRDEGGEVQGVFAAARDVTDIRRYQNLLTQSLSFYLNILDKFPNPIWRSGIDAKCDYFNKAWLDFTGRPLEEEIGDEWVSGVHPEDLERCVTHYLKSFEEREPFCMMYRLHHIDGSYHWITDFGSPLFNPENEFIGYIGSCYDVDKYLID